MKIQQPTVINTGSTLQLTGVDLLKLVMAFCVIAIHVQPLFFGPDARLYPSLFHWFINLAVPFFFIVSGYLLQRKFRILDDKERKTYLGSRIKKLIRIYLYWLLIYFPLTIYTYLQTGQPIISLIKNYIFCVITRGESPLAWPLWYLYSMIIVFTIILLLRKIRHYKAILLFIFAVIAFLNWRFEGQTSGFFKYFNMFTERTLGGGIPIIAGMMLFRYRFMENLWFTFFPCLLVSFMLFYSSLPYWEYFGGVALMSLGLMMRLKKGDIYRVFRQESMWIYYTHMYMLLFMKVLLKIWGVELNIWALLAAGCILTYLLSVLLVRAESVPKLSKIKVLIS